MVGFGSGWVVRSRVLIVALALGIAVAVTMSASLPERRDAGTATTPTMSPSGAKLPPPTRQDLDAIAAGLRSGDPARIAAVVADFDPTVLQPATAAALAGLTSMVFDVATLRQSPEGTAVTIRVTVTFATGETRVVDAVLLLRDGVWRIHSTYATGGI